jgi:hypothetical protein
MNQLLADEMEEMVESTTRILAATDRLFALLSHLLDVLEKSSEANAAIDNMPEETRKKVLAITAISLRNAMDQNLAAGDVRSRLWSKYRGKKPPVH